MIVFLGFFLLLILLLATGLHIVTAIFGTAYAVDILGSDILLSMIGGTVWDAMNNYLLVAIPLFILLGEVLMRCGVADRMYRSLSIWLNWLPGGLLHTNIVSCGFFAAMSGSSVATAATIGTVALPTMKDLKYKENLILGSIAAGGTLGILIPPSINMIVYGALADVSIGQLFIAGIIPGVILIIIMMLIIAILALFGMAKEENYEKKRTKEKITLRMHLQAAIDVVPVSVIFLLIIGSIYGGFATPTEAAAIGLVGSLILASFYKSLSIEMINKAILSALRTTGMIFLILAVASLLNFSISLAGIPQQLAQMIQESGLSAYGTLFLLVVFYLILGCFLESISMMVATIGVVIPIVTSFGFDTLWFGIFMTLMMELALITPPVGLNLFVTQGIRKSQGDITDVYKGVAPFIIAMLIFVIILVYFPATALWLPSKMFWYDFIIQRNE